GEDSVAAVIVEPVTAGGGILVPVAEYFGVLKEICRKYEVLLIADEVVTGFGRTGRMFGHEHWGADPDLVTMAKGIASAYMPLSATSAREEIFREFLRDPEENRLGYFRHISTYGGNAAICAAALENIRIIEERGLCANSEKMGRHLLDLLRELEDLPPVGEVRGLGLLAGIELVADKKTKAPADEQTVGRVVAKAAAQGVLIGKMNRAVPGHNNVLTIAPPLIIQKEQIEQIVRAVKTALENAE
ncbi:MAG: aminotransferase class III-fold pyridoxal phosphate-dependent enzyme, partial [Desulfotomaculales bacterium]